MEYAKDEVFKINYGSHLQGLETRGGNFFCRLLYRIKRHKLLVSMIIAFLLFSIANFFMIYNFLRILQNV